jgi:catechol 2,3-dioxygenase-like lactoylglutathione lyase family enzyme
MDREDKVMKQVASRREFIGAMAAVALPGSVSMPAFAQGSVLPVNTPGLDHLDVIVPDVEKSARFYMGLFKTALHAQPFQGGQRYFVLLGPLPADRTVGYLAIGDARGRGTYIGHFCTSVADWRRDSAAVFAQLKERVSSARFGEFNAGGGVGGIFKDPDGIEIQFLPSPDTLVTAAVPSALVPSGQGAVTPLRVDSALLKVSNMDRALEFYRILYGKETRRAQDSAVYEFKNGSRLLLESTSYAYGNSQARIARYGIRVREFDRAAVKQLIPTLGGTFVADDGKALRLRDADGIELELVV